MFFFFSYRPHFEQRGEGDSPLGRRDREKSLSSDATRGRITQRRSGGRHLPLRDETFMKIYEHEEEFHEKDKKQYRKERKLAQQKDRSKFKKSDLDQLIKNAPVAPPLPPHFQRGRVLSITGEGIWVDFEQKVHLCSLKGAMKKERGLVKHPVVVGDWVYFS